MATVTKPIALDESMNTTESPSRNVADVLAQELSGIASAITGGSDKVPKTDVATVEPSNTASRSYSVGELVYVNGNLYKVIASISMGSSFTVGTNIQSTTVSGALDGQDVTISPATGVSNIHASKAVKIGKNLFVSFYWEGSVGNNNTLATLGINIPSTIVVVGTATRQDEVTTRTVGYQISTNGTIKQISTGAVCTLGQFSAIIPLS